MKNKLESSIIVLQKIFNIRIYLLILSIVFFKLPLYSFDFELVPTNIHFFGAVVAGNNIIAYGSNGCYLMTTDKGTTWTQYYLHPDGNIFHITNFNDTLWGVIDKGIIFYSTDYGLNWVKREFDLDNGESLYFILPTKDCFFVRTTNGIYKLDKKLNVLRTKKDSLLKVRIDNIYDFDGNPVPTFHFASRYSSPEIFLFKNKLLVLSGNYLPGMIVLDYDLNNLDTIVSTEHIYYNVKGSTFASIDYLYPMENVLILNIEGNLYITEDIYSKWRYFFPDTSFLNPNDPERSTKWPWKEYSLEYFFWNDKLFMDIKSYSEGKYLFGKPLGGWTSSPIMYYFKKYNVDETGTVCSFDKYKGYFNDRSITTVHDGWGNRRNATEYIFTKRKAILNDSIIVVPGLFKTLIQTQDGGESWRLISCNASHFPELILNDATFVYFNRTPYFNTTAVTFDAGITFHPTELYLDTLFRRIYTVDTNGNIIRVDYENYDTVSYFTGYEATTAYHIDSTGKGFWIGFGWKHIREAPRFAYTRDFGIRFKFDSILKPYGLPPNVTKMLPPKIERSGDKWVFPLVSNEPPIYRHHTKICYLDTSFNSLITITPEDPILVSRIYPINPAHLILFVFRVDTSNTRVRKFEIRESFDSGKTSNVIASFDEIVDLTQYYVHNHDTIFFAISNPSRIFLLDIKRKILEKLYENEELDRVLLMVISDHFYLVGRELFLENINRNDLTQWREGKWDYGKPSFESVIFKGNVALAGLSDSVRPFNYYKITLSKGTPSSVEDSRIDVRYYTTHFYATQPYPLPARNIVKSKLYWDGSFDLHQAIEGVYDVMGNKIEGKGRITITELGKATAEMVWDCTGVPSGIYFIVVRHNGRADTIPVIVE